MTNYTRRELLHLGAAASVAALAPQLARAQEDPRIKKAKEKGKVTWYTAAFPEDMREALVNSFQKKTGLELSIYAGGGNAIVARLRTERQAGSNKVDVIDAGDAEIMGALVKDGLLKPFKPKGAEAIHADFKDPDGHFYGLYFWTLVLEYNTRFYNKATAPKTFEDLVDPKYKGKIVISDPARSTGGLGVVKAMVKSKGWPWIEELLKNDTLVMSITPGIQPAVVKGERPIALMTSQFTAKSIEEGAPIALATDEMLFGSADVLGVLKDAPNSEGAELLVEHLISKEAQEVVRAHGPYSCRTDVAPPPGMPAIKDLKLRYKTAPALDISAKEIADKFHAILRTASGK